MQTWVTLLRCSKRCSLPCTPHLTSPHKQVTLNIYIRFLIHINVKNICLLYFEGSGHSRFLSVALSHFNAVFTIMWQRFNMTRLPPWVSLSNPTPPCPGPCQPHQGGRKAYTKLRSNHCSNETKVNPLQMQHECKCKNKCDLFFQIVLTALTRCI